LQAEGQISPKRIKDFSSILQAHIPASSSRPLPLGGLAFHFAPDSSRLIMSTAVPSYILVIDLTGEKPCVLRRFDHHRIQDSIVHYNSALKGRALKGIQIKAKINGVHINGDVDTEMADVDSPQEEEEEAGDEEKNSDEDEAEEEEDEKITTAALISVDRIAVSADGQWLATSDNQARTHIFNLDSISVSSFNHFHIHSIPDPISP
jgi:U3 small nucleolar RNA-associated protein 4